MTDLPSKAELMDAHGDLAFLDGALDDNVKSNKVNKAKKVIRQTFDYIDENDKQVKFDID